MILAYKSIMYLHVHGNCSQKLKFYVLCNLRKFWCLRIRFIVRLAQFAKKKKPCSFICLLLRIRAGKGWCVPFNALKPGTFSFVRIVSGFNFQVRHTSFSFINCVGTGLTIIYKTAAVTLCGNKLIWNRKIN